MSIHTFLRVATQKSAFNEKACFMDMKRGERLREIRTELGFTQKAMAENVGMSERGWQEIEKGTNPPSGETLLKIAALGYGPTWILTGKGSKLVTSETVYAAPSASTMASFVATIIKEVRRLIVRVYKEEQVTLPSAALDPEMERQFEALLGRLDRMGDVEEAKSLLPWLENRMRKDLREAVAAPGTGKREAS